MPISRRFLLAALACGLLAAFPAASAAATTIGDPQSQQKTCGWGYSTIEQTHPGVWAVGESVTVPAADTTLNSFSFWVSQLDVELPNAQPGPRTITYTAYVAEWDGQTVGATVWQSQPQQVTTTATPQEIVTQTGGVTLAAGGQYALFLSTHETSGAMQPSDLACIHSGIGFYDGGEALFWAPHGSGQPWETTWQHGGGDTAFSATFSSPTGTPVYAFDGFYQPIENRDASGRLVLNRVQAGQAIPIKFSLGGDHGLDVFEAGYPRSETIACNSNAEVNGVDQTVNAGSSSLSYASGSDTYTYVWKTDKAWADSCRQLVLRFDDGTTARANFSFKQ